MKNAAQILQEIAQEKIKLIEKFEKETGTRFHGLANFNSCYEKAREYFEQQLINKEE